MVFELISMIASIFFSSIPRIRYTGFIPVQGRQHQDSNFSVSDCQATLVNSPLFLNNYLKINQITPRLSIISLPLLPRRSQPPDKLLRPTEKTGRSSSKPGTTLDAAESCYLKTCFQPVAPITNQGYVTEPRFGVLPWLLIRK